MKRIYLLITILFTFTALQAQVKQPTANTLPIGDTTYTVQLKSSLDTVKVRVVAYGEHNSMLWLDGYAVRLFLIEVKSKKPVDNNPAQVRFYSKTWEQLKPGDVIEELSKPLNWK